MLTTYNGIGISGIFSTAGFGSCIKISSGKQKKYDILFDCGVIDEELILSGSHVFITHGHTDHVGGCIPHARQKALMKHTSKYYVPKGLVEHLEAARVAFSNMDGKNIPMDINHIGVGNVAHIGKNIYVECFSTNHRVESQGYAVYTLSPRKLKMEFQNYPSHFLQDFLSKNMDIFEEQTKNYEIAYTGDTTIDAFFAQGNSFLFHVPILIMELTYLDGDDSKAKEHGHIHINDIIQYQDYFENEAIVFVHFSRKYCPYYRALELLIQNIPEKLMSRVYVALGGLGAHEPLTKLDDAIHHHRHRRSHGQ